ncbi:MAG TPA: hypothetical protein DCL21_00045 [Alphaproteobacteria bacterium]|nr:hypothetical protein [Alphaproteobacteria bacterium]
MKMLPVGLALIIGLFVGFYLGSSFDNQGNSEPIREIVGEVTQISDLSSSSRCISVKSPVTELLDKVDRVCYVTRDSKQGMFVEVGSLVRVKIISDRGGDVKIAEVYIER